MVHKTILTANDGGSGDYYTIEDEGKFYIFDGGNKKNLSYQPPNKVDIIICSHDDEDHSEGIKSILKNQNIDVKEVWLPGYWQPIITFVKENGPFYSLIGFDLLNNLFKEKYESDIKINDLITADEHQEGMSIESFNSELKSQLNHIELGILFPINISFNELKRLYKFNFRVKNIIEIAKLAADKGCNIRWFLPEQKEQKSIYRRHLPFKSKNAREMMYIKKVKDNSWYNFFQILSISPQNRYSLVFEYLNKEENPIILFTADSDLFFLNNTLNYKNNEIIITAPHHGSESNKDAYNKIKGTKITWIKSGGSLNCKTGNTFKRLKPPKYCNKCKSKNKPPKICSFEYINNKWYHQNNGYRCIC